METGPTGATQAPHQTQPIRQDRLHVSTGNPPWTLNKVGHWERDPPPCKAGGQGNVLQRRQPRSCPWRARDEGGDSGQPQHEEVHLHGTGTEKPWNRGKWDDWGSGERRPLVGWVRLWVASPCAGPGNPQTVLYIFGELRKASEW